MADTASSPSNSWLDSVLNTGSTLFKAYNDATKPAAVAAPTPVQTSTGTNNSKWYIIGAIAGLLLVLVLLRRK